MPPASAPAHYGGPATPVIMRGLLGASPSHRHSLRGRSRLLPQLWLVLWLGEEQKREEKRIRGREGGLVRGEREDRNSILCIDKTTTSILRLYVS